MLWGSSFSTVPKNYQHVLSMVYAVKEINENSKILPNISLGFHIFDSHFDAKMTFQNTLNLLFHQNRTVLNYNCHLQTHPVAVVGSLDSETSLHMAAVLGIYKVPQVRCGNSPIYTKDISIFSENVKLFKMCWLKL